MKKTLTLGLVVALALAGCTTTPSQVPEHLLRGPSIVVSRDEGAGWSARGVAVFVDGELAGELSAGAHLSRRVRPGQHRVRFVDSILGVVQADRAQLVTVGDGAVLFRVGFNDGGMFFDRER